MSNTEQTEEAEERYKRQNDNIKQSTNTEYGKDFKFHKNIFSE